MAMVTCALPGCGAHISVDGSGGSFSKVVIEDSERKRIYFCSVMHYAADPHIDENQRLNAERENDIQHAMPL